MLALGLFFALATLSWHPLMGLDGALDATAAEGDQSHDGYVFLAAGGDEVSSFFNADGARVLGSDGGGTADGDVDEEALWHPCGNSLLDTCSFHHHEFHGWIPPQPLVRDEEWLRPHLCREGDICGWHPIPDIEQEAEGWLIQCCGELIAPGAGGPDEQWCSYCGWVPDEQLEDEEYLQLCGEARVCTPSEVAAERLPGLFEALELLRKLIEEAKGDLEDNDMVQELEAYKFLLDLLMGKHNIDEAVMADFQTWLGCNSNPMLDRIGKSQESAEQVLGILRGLLAILTGNLKDMIDDAVDKAFPGVPDTDPAKKTMKDRLLKSLKDKALQVLKNHLKSFIPKIQRALDTGNLRLAVELFAQIKTLVKDALEDEDSDILGWPKEILETIWEHILDEAWELAKETAEDRLERRAIKKLKRILGGTAKAATVIFILKDLWDFFEGLFLLDNYEDRVDDWNDKLLEIIDTGKKANLCIQQDKKKPYNVTYGSDPFKDVTITVIHFVRCYCDDGEQPGPEGKWAELIFPSRLKGEDHEGETSVNIKMKSSSDDAEIELDVPPASQWPCGDDDCFIGAHVVFSGPYEEDELPADTVTFLGAACP